MMKTFFISFLLVILVLASCKNKKSEVAMPAITESETNSGNIHIKRYEQALFNLDKSNLRKSMSAIYPEFAFFMGNEWQDTMNIVRINNFINDPAIRELYDITSSRYADISGIEKGLTNAFALYRQSYPEKPLPHVFTYVSGLDIDNPVYFSDTAMAIGLDIFLGNDIPVYDKAGIPKYKSNRFTPDYLLPQCMLSVSDYLIHVDDQKNTLLDQMIMEGKALYFLDVTLPDVKDEYKIGYSVEQMQWALKNEGNIWAFLIEQQLLFSADPQGITKLMTDAPFTSGFANNSPGRLGAFTGWQIVRDYMKESDGVTLRQLMEDTDAQKILKVSKYKPRKQD